MSDDRCPYCKIKADAKRKTVYKALEIVEGHKHCPDCGASLDRGQQSVEVNGYSDIYKGCLRLIGEVVSQYNQLLDYIDADVESCFEEGEKPSVRLNANKIVEELFLPSYGGTTKANFVKALGIEEDDNEWIIQKENREW